MIKTYNSSIKQILGKIIFVLFMVFSVDNSFASVVVSTNIEFSNYRNFRNYILANLQDSKNNIYLATHLLTDPDIATALFSAKLRGINVKVILHPHGTFHYASRHQYLLDNKVDISLKKLPKIKEIRPTLLVMDNEVWQLPINIDDKVQGSISLRKPNLNQVFIKDLFQGKAKLNPNPVASPIPVPKPKILAEHLTDDLAQRNGQKRDLVIVPKQIKSATIESKGKIPNKLPRVTRMQSLRKGTISSDAYPLRNNSNSALDSIRVPAIESNLEENIGP